MLTKRQKQVLDYIKKYTKENGYSPTLEEIADYLGVKSVSTVHEHLQKLEDGGYLHKTDNQPRSIILYDQKPRKNSIEVPLLGTIAAGRPIEAVETKETISITKNEIGRSGDHYALLVEGNSMIDDGVYDGDIVVVKKQDDADDGQMVIAIVNENEATLKRLYREKDRVRLQPANPSLLPIYTKEIEIRGIVVKVVRNFERWTEVESKANRKLQRHLDVSWDFKGERTKSYTHGMHPYPAMFIPQVARRLLLNYSSKGDTVCDIFCGSGTALIESKLLGRNAYGIDLNPFATFLAKVKTTPTNPVTLSREYLSLLERVKKKKKNIQKPEFRNLEFWFKKEIITDLARIKKAIKNIDNKKIRNFFLVSFSETVRRASNTKNGEFKLVRIKEEEREKHNPDVLKTFKKLTEANIERMREFYEDVDKKTWTKVILGDASRDNGIKDNSVDCIITSPPYGDSRTTVAYGQFSRLSAQWIDIFENPNEASAVDNRLLGGKSMKNLSHSLKSDYLTNSLQKIQKRDEKRAKEVLSFFVDLHTCLKQAHRILKPQKYFCLVIGNRLVKQVRIPTDFIIAELAENIGFTCEDIIVRNIPGKRMPSKNSPTNVAGELEETIVKESIVVLRKT